MALLRNRKVSVVGVFGGEDPKQLFTVRNQDGSTEQVPLNQLSMSEDEHSEFTKEHGERFGSHVNKISNKKYQDIVDSQDPQKINASSTATQPGTLAPQTSSSTK